MCIRDSAKLVTRREARQDRLRVAFGLRYAGDASDVQQKAEEIFARAKTEGDEINAQLAMYHAALNRWRAKKIRTGE
eukprot:258093-Lingulodinium_polyedra.AAC.1